MLRGSSIFCDEYAGVLICACPHPIIKSFHVKSDLMESQINPHHVLQQQEPLKLFIQTFTLNINGRKSIKMTIDKYPPMFSDKNNSQWKLQMKLWQMFADMNKTRHGIALPPALEGKAQEIANAID